jgi:cellobiose epimerase
MKHTNRLFIPSILTSILIISSCANHNFHHQEYFNRSAWADTLDASLRYELLAAWYPRCYDSINNGYVSSFDQNWQPAHRQNKMIVTQARHMWVTSKASLRYPEIMHYKKGARYGLQFLANKMWDKTYGGFYTLVSKEGNQIDSSKNAYGNSFAIFALAAYYEAFKDTSALNLAKETFLWLEQHSHDAIHTGYFQHMRRDGTKIERTNTTDTHLDIGYKDQNSSIHLLEAFTELYQVWPDILLRTRLEEMMLLIRDTIVNPTGSLTLFLTPDWKPISFRDSSQQVIQKHLHLDHVSFGHDVETAYLLLEASHILGFEHDTTTLRIAKRMVDHSLHTGWDSVRGGFYDGGYYFKGVDTLTIVMPGKNWWAQAEALNTLLIMSDKFPNDPLHYNLKFQQQWKYINTYLIDHERGGWYEGGLDKEPFQKTALKGHQWKAAYHDFRSLSNCVDQLRSVGH